MCTYELVCMLSLQPRTAHYVRRYTPSDRQTLATVRLESALEKHKVAVDKVFTSADVDGWFGADGWTSSDLRHRKYNNTGFFAPGVRALVLATPTAGVKKLTAEWLAADLQRAIAVVGKGNVFGIVADGAAPAQKALRRDPRHQRACVFAP